MLHRPWTLLSRSLIPGIDGRGIAWGNTVPTDATAGYAIGCIFLHTDGGVGTSFYINEGTLASCDFNPMTSLVPGAETITNAMIATNAAVAHSKLAVRAVVAKTATATLTAAEVLYGLVTGNHATVAIALTLPTDAVAGAEVIITQIGAAAVTVICAAGFGGGGATVDTFTLSLGQSCLCYYDGTLWHGINFTASA